MLYLLAPGYNFIKLKYLCNTGTFLWKYRNTEEFECEKISRITVQIYNNNYQIYGGKNESVLPFIIPENGRFSRLTELWKYENDNVVFLWFCNSVISYSYVICYKNIRKW